MRRKYTNSWSHGINTLLFDNVTNIGESPSRAAINFDNTNRQQNDRTKSQTGICNLAACLNVFWVKIISDSAIYRTKTTSFRNLRHFTSVIEKTKNVHGINCSMYTNRVGDGIKKNFSQQIQGKSADSQKNSEKPIDWRSLMGYNNNNQEWSSNWWSINTKDVSVGKIHEKALAVRQLRSHFIFTLQKIFPTHYATARRQYQSSNGAVSICSAKILSRRSDA